MSRLSNIAEPPFNNDQLGRKNIAENLKKVLLNTELNVFSITAPWGCGKTYFIENLIKTLEEDSINILYNAWESDFYDSPLIPLLVELLNKLESINSKTELEKDIKFAKKIAKNICNKTSFQIGVNIGVASCSANFNPNKKMFKSEYIEIKNLIQDFKKKLNNIQEKLNKKIIIFIDELDRCNPLYTIRTLEIIKHFFGISNIVFVLALDKSQIENSVRTVFGVEQGTESSYLRKFIDAEFQLPQYSSKEFISLHLLRLKDKIEYFIDNGKYYNLDLQNNKPDEFIQLCDFIFIIANLIGFSLRDIEKFFTRFSLTLDILKESDVLLIKPCIVLNSLALYNIKLFDEYINNGTNEKIKIINEKISPNWSGFFLNSYITSIKNAMNSSRIAANTPESNAVQLRSFLQKNVSPDVSYQEKYLRDYPLKIRFMHQFKTFE